MTNKYIEAIKQLEIDMHNGSLEAAHTICAEMWNEIVENMHNRKDRTVVSRSVFMMADCAYCDVSTRKHKRGQKGCIDGQCVLLYNDRCYYFEKWADASVNSYERRKLALTIADIACSAE